MCTCFKITKQQQWSSFCPQRQMKLQDPFFYKNTNNSLRAAQLHVSSHQSTVRAAVGRSDFVALSFPLFIFKLQLSFFSVKLRRVLIAESMET